MHYFLCDSNADQEDHSRPEKQKVNPEMEVVSLGLIKGPASVSGYGSNKLLLKTHIWKATRFMSMSNLDLGEVRASPIQTWMQTVKG